MNRSSKDLAREVAEGTVSMTENPAEMRAFKEAVALLGWEGKRGSGVVNRFSGRRLVSWATLAAELLQDDSSKRDHQRSAEEYAQEYTAEVDSINLAVSEASNEMHYGNAWAAASGTDVPVVTVMYRTQTPTIRLSEGTAVDAVILEEIIGVTKGLCQSGASLECSLEYPSMGLLRTLPESMLPGQESTVMFQCLPCYEASAEAYVRKLHRTGS